jgi:hypothetical protein
MTAIDDAPWPKPHTPSASPALPESLFRYLAVRQTLIRHIISIKPSATPVQRRKIADDTMKLLYQMLGAALP